MLFFLPLYQGVRGTEWILHAALPEHGQDINTEKWALQPCDDLWKAQIDLAGIFLTPVKSQRVREGSMMVMRPRSRAGLPDWIPAAQL